MILKIIILFGLLDKVLSENLTSTESTSLSTNLSTIETTTDNILENTSENATGDKVPMEIVGLDKHIKCNMSRHMKQNKTEADTTLETTTEDASHLNETDSPNAKRGVNTQAQFNSDFEADQLMTSEVDNDNTTVATTAASTTIPTTISSENVTTENIETTKKYIETTTKAIKTTTQKASTQKVVVITPKMAAKNVSSMSSSHHDNLTVNQDMLSKCPKYKNGAHMDINQMVGEWETIYHIMPEPVSCFKINITRVKKEERALCREKYGDDGQQINWDLCQVDIQSSTADPKIKKHCLLSELGGVRNFGIFDNIVVSDKEAITNDSVVVMRGEPDQWRKIHDLLLLRDCNNGGIVVFGKPSRRPSMDEIRHTLKVYGEFSPDGKLLCDDNDSFGVNEEIEDLDIQ